MVAGEHFWYRVLTRADLGIVVLSGVKNGLTRKGYWAQGIGLLTRVTGEKK